jgi:uncharacterized membrane protein
MLSRSKWAIGLAAIAIVVSLPLYSFQWHLLLHIFGAVIFIGNLIVTALWMTLAERTRKTSVLNFASRVVNNADLTFTLPGVILILLNGLALAVSRWGGWAGFLGNSWITAALVLLVLSGIVWVGFLLRYQFRLEHLSNEAVESDALLPQGFFGVLHKWYVWGVIATILPILSLLLMVFKPKLW